MKSHIPTINDPSVCWSCERVLFDTAIILNSECKFIKVNLEIIPSTIYRWCDLCVAKTREEVSIRTSKTKSQASEQPLIRKILI